MGRDRKNEAQQQQFTKWVYSHRLLPAWKALTYPARDAYFHLQVRCYTEPKAVRNNNGEVYRSLRKLADDMGCSIKTARAALADLQAKGWIIATSPWQRGAEGRGKAATFRFTMLPTAKRPATQEPKRWEDGHDYPVIVYTRHKPKPRGARTRNLTIQNPPTHSDTTPCPNGTHLRAVKL